MDLKIEKNVPPPRLRAFVAVKEWIYLIDKMAPGDSVLVNVATDCDRFRDAAKSKGIHAVTRFDKKAGKYRCWVLGPLNHALAAPCVHV